ncbi:2,3-bisphosphoglycerate-independent phosphoglycerate mutase [Silanimonas sp.]|uniref:2,3-bisphosphoglycerate-independent phosphoglycerate mutase n=1 Tax=Silanimonas sp. TaxID=1929290 RepID=UPI0022C32165|nr:2,3-bisphosphoglycerate-independent phosphoglycerate mutase [Silanimonas sp.]MCZ8115219.1 2,3-bisphosphoglycerate-independent phosphoglycerate mutase [Silanimonas sp.]
MASRPKPVLLLILDGWGHRDETADNAIALARVPHWRRLLAECPHTLVHTEGKFVGLPDGQMGNSEVGHMNIGAGRIVYQDLTRVDAEIESGDFFRNPELLAACHAARDAGGTLHLMGLLSPGGVHSHEAHLFALIEMAKREGVARVAVHAFLDGRDMPPKSAEPSLRALAGVMAKAGNAHLASVSGRYFAMDRDKRWDRVESAYRAMTEAVAEFRAADGLTALEAAYARGENDEFVKPTVIEGAAPMRDGDAMVFFNFRADRARQITAAFTVPGFDGFAKPRAIALSRFVGMAEYSADLPAKTAYAPEDLRDTLGEVIAAAGLKQLRIAETEKYAHVTFFFSGGREALLPGESRELVPSPKVATYDLQPEMSCPELTDKLVSAIRGGEVDFIACNIANPDMIGHTGDLQAAIKAAEAVDIALGRLREAIEAVGGEMLVTADHGNLEMMRDPETGQPHTAHTVGPVPFVYVGRKATLRSGGALRDIAPTVLQLMGLPKPAAMTGESLVQPA